MFVGVCGILQISKEAGKMIWKLLGHGLFRIQKWGGKVLVIFALVSLVATSPYWSQLGVDVPMEMGVAEADVGWIPLPMQPTPTATIVEDEVDEEVVDASAKFADWPDFPYKEWFVREGLRIDCPYQLLASISFYESAFRPYAVSSAGARGIAQFMPGTWKEVMGTSFSNAYDPEQSIIAMATYVETLRAILWDNSLTESQVVRRIVISYCWGASNVLNKGVQAAPLAVKIYAQNILDATGYK